MSLRVLALSFLASFFLAASDANHRVALVVGNSEYSGQDLIQTVRNDALTVSKLLKDRDFLVKSALNQKRDDLRIVLKSFIESTPINGTALIYFGGHSMTVKDNNGVEQVLLLTVDGNRKAILLDDLIEQVKENSAAQSTILLIDSGQGVPPGYDKRRGPVGLNKPDGLPEGVSLHFAMDPNTWSDQAGLMAKKLAESKNSPLEAWLRDASQWRLSTCEPGSISRPASHAIAPPEKLIRGKKAGDEWVSPRGTVFCWCPENGEQSGFWVGKYEARSSKFPTKSNLSGRNLPAHSLKQRDLENHLSALTEAEQKADRLPRGWTYALPSPAQWEYAARAGTKGDRYFSGNPALHANFADHSLFKTGNDLYQYAASMSELNDGFTGLAPVGSFAPNPWGLFDVFGNLWEQTNTGEMRGGSWVSPQEYLKVGIGKIPPSYRQKPGQTHHFPYASEFFGFRLIIREG
jgi:hypothetical protein